MLKYKNKKTENKMSKKRKVYTADFKAKLVLEVLESDKTLNEIANNKDTQT
jgi:putative transposase